MRQISNTLVVHSEMQVDEEAAEAMLMLPWPLRRDEGFATLRRLGHTDTLDLLQRLMKLGGRLTLGQHYWAWQALVCQQVRVLACVAHECAL